MIACGKSCESAPITRSHTLFPKLSKDQDKVLIYNSTQFRVLYDFTVQPQDQWTAYGPSFYNMCDTMTIIHADAVGTEDVNGVSLKYIDVTLPEFGWNFSFCGPEQIRISEKFGSYG